MIRYKVDWADLRARIDAASPKWFSKARKLTQANEVATKHIEHSKPHWSKIKEIFLIVQHDKCAYCERKAEGKYEFDVEHFRPKSSYFELAYDIGNYVISCKTCNTKYKSNTFPIAGLTRRAAIKAEYVAERPLLLNPLAQDDVDPSKVIEFDGILPVPVSQDPSMRERAKTNIEFFRLDDRELLWQERARVLCQIWQALPGFESAPAGSPIWESARSTLEFLTSAASAHTNCARSFLRTCLADPLRAGELAELAAEYLGRCSVAG